MRYLVVSDVHGIYEYGSLIPSIMKKERCNELILLGDLFYHGLYDHDRYKLSLVYNGLKNQTIGIKGNNDTEYDMLDLEYSLSNFARLNIGNKMFYFTHGHLVDEYNFPDACDVLVMGHTHRSVIKRRDDKFICNPGSISLPRDNKHSYMIIDDKMIYIKDIDGNVIDSTCYLK